MSAVLANREIKPRRQDGLADETVNVEPVSGSEFPVIREKNKEFLGITGPGPKIGAYLKAIAGC